MSYIPMTRERWLSIVRENQENLSNLILDWHPVSRITNHRSTEFIDLDGDLVEIEKPALKITAPSAEYACGVVRKKIVQEENGKGSPVERFKTAVAAEDINEIMSLLSSAWFGVPESTSCWSIPGFGVACDLMDDPPEEDNGN
jgi:hypothetical protein